MDSPTSLIAAAASVIGIRIGGVLIEIAPGFALDPFAPCLLAFCNRERDKIKILHWDHNGFWLYYRRLEKGRFKWPQQGNGTVVVTRRELRWLLDGLSLEQRQAHPAVMARTVV